jgi:hypothetical protein
LRLGLDRLFRLDDALLGERPRADRTIIPLCFLLGQQFREFGKNGGNALGLIAREQLATPKSAKRLLFEIHVGKGLPVGVLYHKAAIEFLD